jgi:hypothetical protein
MVPAVSDRITRVPPYSGASAVDNIVFAYGAFTLCGRLFQNRSANDAALTAGRCSFRSLVLQPPVSNACRLALTKFGLFPVRSPLLRESLVCFLFLEVLRCFTSLGSLYPAYAFSRESTGITPLGFPHSEISGSKDACSSPKRIAAGRVLHRLLAPRYPPFALTYLTS